jgi:hypothetical protein
MNNNFLLAISLQAIRVMIKNKLYDDALEQLTSLYNLLETESTLTVENCITDKVFKTYDDLCNQ